VGQHGQIVTFPPAERGHSHGLPAIARCFVWLKPVLPQPVVRATRRWQSSSTLLGQPVDMQSGTKLSTHHKSSTNSHRHSARQRLTAKLKKTFSGAYAVVHSLFVLADVSGVSLGRSSPSPARNGVSQHPSHLQRLPAPCDPALSPSAVPLMKG
jgi:hypothetical protein